MIVFKDETYALNDDESVLECMERNGHVIPNSCRTGVCQSCLMKSVSGPPPKHAQKGLKDSLQAQNMFLSCVCYPEEALEISQAHESNQAITAHIVDIQPLNKRVIKVILEPAEPIEYFPGQFINLVHDTTLVRSYSLASVPANGEQLECHVAIVPDGKMSGWLHNDARPGNLLEVVGPIGHCFYTPQSEAQPMFLFGTGTGLAPLYGIARDALQQSHQAPIHLFHGGLVRHDLYLVEELRQLAEEHEHFFYHPCVRNEEAESWVHHGSIDEIAFGLHSDLKGWKVFLCGDPNLVRMAQRKAFLSGASMQDILADAFLPAGGSK